jgi:hypothetical protein
VPEFDLRGNDMFSVSFNALLTGDGLIPNNLGCFQTRDFFVGHAKNVMKYHSIVLS